MASAERATRPPATTPRVALPRRKKIEQEEEVITRACLICGAPIRVSGEEELFPGDLCCDECVADTEAAGEVPAGRSRSTAFSRGEKFAKKRVQAWVEDTVFEW